MNAFVRSWALPALCLLPIAIGLVSVSVWSPDDRPLATYVTSLRGRTPGQIRNAALACRYVNGTAIAPGKVFSFNRKVGPWSRDRGYCKAPVSYGGEMIVTWGGGVCQVSSTLYNSALLSGLKVRERDHHVWPASYVPVGRDAAVAYSLADLKIQNPYDVPVRIQASVEGDHMVCQVWSRARARLRYRIVQDHREVIPPTEVALSLTQDGPRRARVLVMGKPGYRVRTYREGYRGDIRVSRELLSDDYYKPLSRVVRVSRE